MKLKEIKTAREVKLPSTRVEFVTENTSLKEVILRPEGEEASYSIRPGTSYSEAIKVFERRKFETKTVHRMKGTFMGLTVHEDFETSEEARRRAEELRSKDDSADFSVAQVDVLVDEAGEPVPGLYSDIPF